MSNTQIQSVPLKASVAMTTYNGQRYIPRQIDSICAQTRKVVECVVCDDNSADESLAVVDSTWTGPRETLSLHRNMTRLGYAENFSHAIAKTHGDIVFLSDQDDVWHPDKVKRILTVFESKPEVGLVFTDANVVDARERPLGYTLWEAIRFASREQNAFQSGNALDVLIRQYCVTGATMAFRSIYKPLVLPIPGDVFHDGWIAFLIASVAAVEFLPQTLIDYRQHASQAVGARRTTILAFVQDRLRAPQGHAVAELRKEIRFHQALRDRLLTTPEGTTATPALQRLDDKLRHLDARLAMRLVPPPRLRGVFREYAAGRYDRFSSSWTCWAGDLLAW